MMTETIPLQYVVEPPKHSFVGLVCGLLPLLVKSAKVLKVALIGASLAAYSWLLTWQMAVIVVIAILLHESGHLWAVRRCGFPTKGIWLIPFLGGVAVGGHENATRWQDMLIAAAGPAVGIVSMPLIWMVGATLLGPSGGAGACAIVAMVTLFNLLPIFPLDGGRMMSDVLVSVSPKAGLIATTLTAAVGIVLFASIHAYLLAFVVAMTLAELIFKVRRIQRNEDVARMTAGQMVAGIGGWLAMVVVLAGIVTGASMVPGADIAMSILQDEPAAASSTH